MDPIQAVVAAQGGVAYRSTILDAGFTGYELGRAVHSERLKRVRRGWYALSSASEQLVRAVRVGGAVTGVSAAAHYGLWALDDGRLHVAVPYNAGRLRSPEFTNVALRDATDSAVCLHWRARPGFEPIIVEPLVDVLVHTAECQSEESGIALVDSALNRRLTTVDKLRAIPVRQGVRWNAMLDKVDPASQSGTESLARIRLRSARVHVATQVPVPDVGRVDLLVGERLVIECDSRTFHSGEDFYRRDRERDLVLVGLGYAVLRLTYAHVVYEWPRIEKVILRLIREGKHLWPRTRIDPFSGGQRLQLDSPDNEAAHLKTEEKQREGRAG